MLPPRSSVGAWIGCRRAGVSFSGFLDAVAPGVLFAQGLGRWGNWFNNELYGDPTSLPWKLQIHQLDKRYRLGAGAFFTLYVLNYTAERFGFELMRSDPPS